jgi:hypothetical protein
MERPVPTSQILEMQSEWINDVLAQYRIEARVTKIDTSYWPFTLSFWLDGPMPPQSDYDYDALTEDLLAANHTALEGWCFERIVILRRAITATIVLV